MASPRGLGVKPAWGHADKVRADGGHGGVGAILRRAGHAERRPGSSLPAGSLSEVRLALAWCDPDRLATMGRSVPDRNEREQAGRGPEEGRAVEQEGGGGRASPRSLRFAVIGSRWDFGPHARAFEAMWRHKNWHREAAARGRFRSSAWYQRQHRILADRVEGRTAPQRFFPSCLRIKMRVARP